MGQLADRYAYLGSKQVQVTKDLNPDSKIYRVKVYEQDNSLTKTLIVASYFFTGSISFLIALAIKAIYKTYLNFVYERVETKRDLQVLPLTLDLPIEKVKEPAPMANTVVAQKKIGETLIVLSTGDLTLENADVIVNAANRSLLAGNGVCRAIHSRAGDSIFKECKTLLEQKNIKQIECGEAVVTTAGKMQQAKAVIHTAGPDCRVTAENGKRKELLKKAYLNSLLLAAGRHPNQKEWISSDYKNKNEPINSIAFPSISTGIFQYPLEEAVAIVFEALQEFIKEYPDALKEIRFVFLANNPEPKAYLSALDKISANT